MESEEFSSTIDQKLSELYETLTTINILKDKTVAVHEVVSALSEAGKGRVTEIEKALKNLETALNKTMVNISKAMGDLAGKFSSAVNKAGQENVESVRVTTEAFAKSISDLIKEANDEVSKFTRVVAELKELPLVDELRSTRQEGIKLNQDLQRAITQMEATVSEETAKIDGSLTALIQNIKDSQEAANKIDCTTEAIRTSIEEKFAQTNNDIQKLFADNKSSLQMVTEGFIRGETIAQKCRDQIVEKSLEQTATLVQKIEVVANSTGEVQRSLDLINQNTKDSFSRINAEIGRAKELFVANIQNLEDEVERFNTNIQKGIEAAIATIVKEQHQTRVRVTALGVFIVVLIIIVMGIIAPLGVAGWKAFLQP